MREEYIVYKNKKYTSFKPVQGGYVLLSYNPEMLKEGYKEYEIVFDNILYGKFVPYNQVTHRFRIYDRALYKKHEYDIADYKKDDPNFVHPDAYVQLLVYDKKFLYENDLVKGSKLLDDKYGQMMFCSGKIPVSEVTILRRREELPIKGR